MFYDWANSLQYFPGKVFWGGETYFSTLMLTSLLDSYLDGHWHSRPFGYPLTLPILALVTPHPQYVWFASFWSRLIMPFLPPLCSVAITFFPFSQSLLETHDSVASKSYETPPPSPVLDPMFNNQPVPPDAVRMVGIRKTAGEHLVSKYLL